LNAGFVALCLNFLVVMIVSLIAPLGSTDHSVANQQRT